MSDEINQSILDEKYQETFRDFSKQKTIKKIYKISLISLLVIYLILVLVYFSMPTFKISGMKFNGLFNLTDDDIITLMNERPSNSLLFFSDEGKDRMIIENANGIIINDSVVVSSDAFSGSVKVIEDYPVCYIDDTLYFASSTDFDNYIVNLEGSRLSDNSKVRLKNLYQNYAIKDEKYHLPKVHIPSSYSASSTKINDAIKYLVGADFNTLSTKISDINYRIYTSSATNFNSVSEIYVDKSLNENIYSFVLTNIRSNFLVNILNKNTFDSIVESVNYKIYTDSSKIKNSTYVTSDDITYNDVYYFRFRYDDKSKLFSFETVKNI